ncbi:MAG: transglycosylase SLT domain-containing protein [Candidatus Eisenbacteria bacterium]|jgi:hypothetical protein|nr:transglycosylase SLT domain-containing protein [Candidatus Eisenbacteria bacterium]
MRARTYATVALISVAFTAGLPGSDPLAQPEIPDTVRPVSARIIPERLTLCGEEVPLDREDVRERLEREFYFNLDREGQLVLYLKRAARTMPVVQRVLRELGLPDDLKYVPVAESGLYFRAASAAEAMGYWQFIKGTATRYGLTVGTYVDERRDLEKSTRAAAAYLKDLRNQFGSWAVALGAYNWGENRMERALSEQGSASYYDLYLPDETDRFVFRIACLKLLLENPQGYDIYLPEDRLYHAPATEEVEVTSKGWLQMVALSRAAQVSARTFRYLNPWMNAHTLPPGTYRFTVPEGQAQGFPGRASRPGSTVPPQSGGQGAVHLVRVGDSLTRLAMRYGVSLEDLERWNGISRRDAIHPGQRLIVGNRATEPG